MELIRRLQRVRVVRYLFVGCCLFAVELGSLLGLMHWLQVSAPAATAIAYWIGLLLAFGAQKVFSFQDYRHDLKILTVQGAIFTALTVWNWVFTVWFVGLFSDEHIIFSRSLAIIIMAAWNYVIYKEIIFKQPSHKTSPLLERIASDELLKWSVLLVTGWRLALEGINQVVALSTHTPNWLYQWTAWDGGWYIHIQQHGYLHTPGTTGQENVAFFPAFPHITGWLGSLLHIDPVIVGLTLNTALTVGIVYFLMKLTKLFATRFGVKNTKQLGLLSAALLLAFPASFYFAAYYAEAMLVFGALGAVYFASTKRLWWAIPFMVLASATKVIGSIIVVVVALIVFDQWRREHSSPLQLVKQWAITAIGWSGAAAFMLYQWVQFGNPLLFYAAQKAWGRNDGGFFVTRLVKNYYLHLFDPGYFGGRSGYILNLFLMTLPFILLGVAVYAWRKYKVIWPAVLAFFALALPLSTGIMDSINRYSMVAAPLIPFAALWLQTRTHKRAIVVGAFIVSVLLLVLFAGLFLTNDYFVG